MERISYAGEMSETDFEPIWNEGEKQTRKTVGFWGLMTVAAICIGQHQILQKSALLTVSRADFTQGSPVWWVGQLVVTKNTLKTL